jgi:hypothetical protein
MGLAPPILLATVPLNLLLGAGNQVSKEATMTQHEMGTESARSPQTSPQQQGAVSFPKGLPNLSGVQGTRRWFAIAFCIAGLILAPLAVILFLADANETYHAAIPTAVFFQVVLMFALFGAAVWILTTSVAKSPEQK